MCPFLGNMLYSLALTYKSMKLALVGRALCGFGSAEVINRQLISACVSVQGMTRASALFVTASAIGMGIGPLIAGEIVNLVDPHYVTNLLHITSLLHYVVHQLFLT